MSKDCTSIVQKLQKHIQDKEQEDKRLLAALKAIYRNYDSPSICPSFFNDDPKVYVDLFKIGLKIHPDIRAFGFLSKETNKIVFVCLYHLELKKCFINFSLETANEIYQQHTAKNNCYTGEKK